MALLFGRHRRDITGSYGYGYGSGYAGDWAGASAQELIPSRPVAVAGGIPPVTSDSALRHSAVWAATRLRANLISTFPIDVFRRAAGVDGSQVEIPTPPIFKDTGGAFVDFVEWRYSTQIDLDRSGNAFGLITERSGYGLPQRIELVPSCEVSIHFQEGRMVYRFGRQEVDPADVWHEKQYTLPGLPVGLSPLAYAAWTIGEYLSIQDFALTWFGGGGVPRGHLKNKMQTMSPATADAVKTQFKKTVLSGDPFVTGADWEYDMIQAEQTGLEWLRAKELSLVDIARYFDVPADLIDASMPGSAVTYANLAQRNLQFLGMNLGPTIARRENAWNRLLPDPQYCKLNTDALLRMDPLARSQIFTALINSRVMTPDEARLLDNRRALTNKQIHEFDRLFGSKNPPPAPAVAPGARPPAKPPAKPPADAQNPGGN